MASPEEHTILSKWLLTPEKSDFPTAEEYRVGKLLCRYNDTFDSSELFKVLPTVSSLLVEPYWTRLLAEFGFEKLGQLTSYKCTEGSHASLSNFDKLVKLRTLVLHRTFLESEEFLSLAKSIKSFSHLRSLSLRGNIILRDEAEELASSLLNLRGLEILDLSNCSIGWSKFHFLFKCEPKPDPKPWKTLLGALAQISSLRMLILSMNNLYGEAGKALASQLPSLRQVSVLVLGNGLFGDGLFNYRVCSEYVYGALMKMSSLNALGFPSRRIDFTDCGTLGRDLDMLLALPVSKLHFKLDDYTFVESAVFQKGLEKHGRFSIYEKERYVIVQRKTII